MQTKSKLSLRAALSVAVIAMLAACGGDDDDDDNGVSNANDTRPAAEAGAVYVMTNQPLGNAVAVFGRGADGSVALQSTVATGGLGTGELPDSQGSLNLNADRSLLFASNIGSDNVTVFSVSADGLTLTQVDRVPTGDRPVSLTINDGILYVLNSGNPGGITGFTIGADGSLTPIPGSSQPLSTDQVIPCSQLPFPREEGNMCNVVSPGEVNFSPDGEFLVVTERFANQFGVYPVDDNGIAGAPSFQPSVGETPFGFAFDEQGRVFVANAAQDRPDEGSASSYNLSDAGDLSVITGTLDNQQAASCWLTLTPDGDYAYVSNPRSHSVTGYAIGADGSLALLDGEPPTSGESDFGDPHDLQVGPNGHYLYIVDPGAFVLEAFEVNADGSLSRLPGARGFPQNSVGLAVF